MTFGGHGMMMSSGAALQPLMAVAHMSAPYVSIYNTSTWTKLPSPSVLPTGDGWGVAFSPDDCKLAVSHSNSPYLTIYNTATWEKIDNPSILPAGPGSVSWSPDGSKLAVAHVGSPYLTIYNTSDWSAVPNPSTLPTGQGVDVHFSADGAMLLVSNFSAGGNNIIIYNVSDWTTRSAPNPGNNGYNGVGAYAARFSPDGTKLACAGDGLTHVYRLSDNAELVWLNAIGHNSYDVAWSPDGNWLCSGNAQGGGRYAPVYRVSDWGLVSDSHAPGNKCCFNTTSTVLADGSDYGFNLVSTATWTALPALSTPPAGQTARIAFNSIG